MSQQPQQHRQQQQQQQWTADQRRQQIAELLRNKGVICRDYLCTSHCPRTPTCPYMHVSNGETRPVPWSVCTFFTQGKCLRDRCTFFHGTQAQLEELHATGSPVYRPQDYMKIAVPPPEYLNPDGSIATSVSFSAVPPTPTMQVMRGPAMPHENAVNTFQPLVLMQQSPQAITPSMFSGQGNTPNSRPSQFPFYASSSLTAQMPMQATTTVFSPGLQTMPTAAYYQSANPQMMPPPPQQYASPSQYNTPHQQAQQQPNSQPPQQQQHPLGNQLYFHIQSQ
ncbi:hypothetical protein ABB37_00762 [Leptomonas pyrrhocoris]|uniref:C3H1-type domain-containing protein n=1 Tax=Leptomonas pyrrhocoris TaxID=157538 RepID=A0A0M9GB13_LEPPY|nr:hypothetical protein ABB37_00762 [Leptomonas pyrrhocoris]KPA86660.1 hypothetical protein ABB37_00762 [Leptomonas pyrrhocoris]|eukprot:XP_015665099.1 hypothetical protein ABB37_00762 [Leptomonas pyrrhocoris]